MLPFSGIRCLKMTKRIVSAILIGALLCAFLGIGAFAANYLDKTVADIKIYADKQVKLGDEFIVSIYIENITLSGGIVANDLPLYFDADKLTVLAVECVFPQAWNGFGDFFGINPPVTEQPYYLRSLPDASDLMTNTSYRITESKAIGYKVKFKADKIGKAEISVKNDSSMKNPIMLVAINGEDISNYGANGMTVSVEVVKEIIDDSSVDDVSVEEPSSQEPSFDVSDDVSGNASEDVSTGEASDIASEDVSSRETIEVSESQADESSSVADDKSVESDSSDADGNTGFDKSIMIIIVCAVLALSAVVAAVAVYVNKKKKDAE